MTAQKPSVLPLPAALRNLTWAVIVVVLAYSYRPAQHSGWVNVLLMVLVPLWVIFVVITWLDKRYGNRGTR